MVEINFQTSDIRGAQEVRIQFFVCQEIVSHLGSAESIGLHGRDGNDDFHYKVVHFFSK